MKSLKVLSLILLAFIVFNFIAPKLPPIPGYLAIAASIYYAAITAYLHLDAILFGDRR